jgi:hypothetical protein
MGLDVAGRHDEARAAYEWLGRVQNPDGSWFRSYHGSTVVDHVREANFAAYLAVGLLHHVCHGADDAFLDRIWPTLTGGLDFTLGLQAPGGEIAWARSIDGRSAGEALLTGCSSIFHSLRCALALAKHRGEPQPDWELAATTLGHAIVAHPERFSPRERFSMDWYYPILGGALRGPAAFARLDGGWSTFVVPGSGGAVRERPAVGDRGRDVRAGAGPVRARRPRAGGRAVREHAAPAPRRRFLLDGLRLPGRRPVAGRADDLDRGGGAAGDRGAGRGPGHGGGVRRATSCRSGPTRSWSTATPTPTYARRSTRSDPVADSSVNCPLSSAVR